MAAIAPTLLIPGYALRRGSGLDRALLVKFMQRTYRELHPQQRLSHLAETVERHFSRDTPLWWVDVARTDPDALGALGESALPVPPPIGCLWLGNAIDQVRGKRYAHILLLYVDSKYRRRGIGSALVRHAEQWARDRGDDQIGLQVFQHNQPALSLYQQLDYRSQAFWMVKGLR